MPPKEEYSPGDTVFAKLKGYPWWPARVEDDTEIPAKILKQKSKTKSPLYTVFFYGSRDYGFFGPENIRPFDREAVERDLKAKKFKTKDLEHAVHQALDPSLLKAEEEAEAAEDEEEEEEEEEDEEMEEEVKPKKKERKRTTTTKKAGNNKKLVKRDSTKRARLEEDSEIDTKKRRKSLSMEQEEDTLLRRASPALSRKSEEPSQPNSSNPHFDLEKFKKTHEYKKTYHSRHKLQKMIYEKRPGEIPKEDYQRISQILKEVEDTHMTFDLLRYTKIGKVLKYGCGYTFEDDEYNIKQRCLALMKRWKSVLSTNTERPAAEQQHHESAQEVNGNHV